MADLYAARLIVTHHDGSKTRYRDVTYCPWRDGVTVYRDGEEIGQHVDVLFVEVPAAVAVS